MVIHFLLKLISIISVGYLLAFGLAFWGHAYGWYRERTGSYVAPLFWTLLWLFAAIGWLVYMFS